MTKNDLVNAVANHGLSKRQSSSVVESVFDIIFRCFEKGEDVKIVGFGHFRIRRKASRRGRNPQTGESIETTARKVLTFKPSAFAIVWAFCARVSILEGFRLICDNSRLKVGAWRSPVAHMTGGHGVAGSNPVAPTIFLNRSGFRALCRS